LLTVHDYIGILDETVDDSENFRSSRPSLIGLILRQSVQPVQYRFDILLSETLLYRSGYAAFSKVTYKQEWTYSIVSDQVFWLPALVWRVTPPSS